MPARDVIPMTDFAGQVDEVGPKLVGLASLAGWGYRVPDGFAVTRQAVRELAAASSMPEVLEAAIDREYLALCERLGREQPVLAVRSAATIEDGEGRSYAGMFETVLGVRGVDALYAAIHTCVASQHSSRVDQYDGGKSEVAMTVGVQELIDARASGVAFSRHPVTHRDDRLVIEGVVGLGSVMVDGLAQPDHLEVGRADLRLLRCDVGDKRRRAVLADGGGLRVEETPDDLRRSPCLEPDDVRRLCQAVVDIERRLDRAVDVEWVIARDGSLVLVQARPITGGPRDAREPVRWDPAHYARQLGGRRAD